MTKKILIFAAVGIFILSACGAVGQKAASVVDKAVGTAQSAAQSTAQSIASKAAQPSSQESAAPESKSVQSSAAPPQPSSQSAPAAPADSGLPLAKIKQAAQDEGFAVADLDAYQMQRDPRPKTGLTSRTRCKPSPPAIRRQSRSLNFQAPRRIGVCRICQRGRV
jgi:hypothetical protein